MRSPILLFIVTIFGFSCTKIDSTVLGGDLIPPIDNVNTFDTTIDVETINLVQNDDSTLLSYTDLLAVGSTNDPLFGQSAASLSFELKPTNFPSSSISLNPKDSLLFLDSALLRLRYSGGFGDTNQLVTFQVFMLKEKFNYTIDYSIKQTPPLAELIPVGTKTISLASLNRDSITVSSSTTYRYKTIRELRIPLDSLVYNWRTKLLQDTASLKSDTLYTEAFKGFVVKMTNNGTPGSIAYFNISDTASRLQFFYRRRNNGIDTIQTSYYFNPNNSGFADNITWTKGGEILSHLSPLQPDPLVYIKTTPGTAARIRIPGLQALSNRIVHRAELKMYQVPVTDPRDSLLVVPPLLYLERFEPGNIAFNKYQSIPIDLSPNTAYNDCFPPSTSGIDYAYFGGFPKNETVNNTTTKAYTFNISRYVQQIITKKLVNADLRLSSNLYSQYDGCGAGTGPIRVTSNPIGYGRVRLGGGNATGNNLPYKMRLRIIYSKL